MRRISLSVFLASLSIPIVVPSNILVFLPSPWKSHIVSFQPLFLELARRNHNVTVVSKFRVTNPPPNYTQVIIDYELDFESVLDSKWEIKNKYLFLTKELYFRNTISVGITERFVSSPEVQKFVKDDRSTFDLVIVESFFQECTVAIGHKYDAPVINIVPVTPWVIQSFQAANPLDFSYIKDFTLNSGASLDFQSRLLNALLGLYGLIFEPIDYFPKMEKLMNVYFQYPGHENRPPLMEMIRNVSLSLIDSDLTIISSRPYVPNFVEVLGVHLRPPTKNIDQKLRNFMDSADDGIVYFNFGTLVNIATLPEPILKVLVNVLGRMKQKIIFKWSNNDTRQFPDNFYVDAWLPQLDILKHPNCKLFITHGGVHGIMETVYAGVPIIGFPVFGDQYQNLRISQDNGFCMIRDILTLTEESFERDLKLMLTDQKYTENVKKMSAIFHDRPMSALDKAVYWVEYVINHKGAHHLHSAATKLTWYQYYLLDVVPLLTSVVIFLICVCYYIAKRSVNLTNDRLSKRMKIKSS